MGVTVQPFGVLPAAKGPDSLSHLHIRTDFFSPTLQQMQNPGLNCYIFIAVQTVSLQNGPYADLPEL